ncbi:cystathionine beta-synthase [Photobacterium gaetbulicola]|uniref:Cystathionine beta-synthase n=1 Tax=Photobacterium gaetbulicola TaxID=1295392 RepID=A0A0B9H320_9GAMM|nr:DmsE family decaheme c-type cytochrome [Photobacterium gaetbulicola]KHT63267.1 cystathionine beta-synthase [Photobacterium gaetbulicola]
MNKRKWWSWAVSGILIMLVSMMAFADTENRDPREAVEAELDKKFQDGRYSRDGTETCLRCHDKDSEIPATGIFDNVHGRLGVSHGPMSDRQCEACHGPLGNHHRNPRGDNVREPMITFGDDSPVPASKQNSVCLSCHQGSAQRNWHSSVHAFEDVSCSSCHKLHQAEDPMFNQATQVETCTGCHSQVKAQLHKRSSHPIRDGVMSCSSCHEPHQSVNEASLKQVDINENCYQCHAEKRGPFLWEHEPVSEDCSYCHNPHGSINSAMLDKRMPQLCQDCHRVPHAQVDIPEGDLRVRGGSCMNCHSQVHGTNHPRGLTLRK